MVQPSSAVSAGAAVVAQAVLLLSSAAVYVSGPAIVPIRLGGTTIVLPVRSWLTTATAHAFARPLPCSHSVALTTC